MTLDEIKERCFINDDGCWLWRGALTEGKWPRIHAPDLSLPDGPKRTQTGRRATWQLKTGKAIPNGWRVYGTCLCDTCVNPDHSKCGPTAELGKFSAKLGRFKGSHARITANRRTGRMRAILTPEQVLEIQASPEMNRQLAERLGVSHQTISRARRGDMKSLQAANPFVGLLR